MTVRELYSYLDERIPRSLSCEWDNDGLMCCPDADREVRRVLVALDVTEAVVDAAVEGGYDAVISHHPFIFKGLRAINGEDHISAKALKLIRAGISVMSFHTRLDAVKGGVNDLLCELLSIRNPQSLGEEGIGRIGELESEESLSDFALRVKKTLNAPVVLYADACRAVKRVAVLGGEGSDDISMARLVGADTYVSGRLGYHNMTDAPEMGMNLIEAGHFYTEDPVCLVLCELVTLADKNVKCDRFFSGNIHAV